MDLDDFNSDFSSFDGNELYKPLEIEEQKSFNQQLARPTKSRDVIKKVDRFAQKLEKDLEEDQSQIEREVGETLKRIRMLRRDV